MTASDDAEGAWAGDDIPVPEPPSDTVAVPSRSRVGPPIVDSPDPVGAPRLGPIAPSQPNVEQPLATSGRTRNVVVGVLLAGFALVAAVLLVGGNDDPVATDDSTTTEAPPDTIERNSTTSVPSTPTTAPSVRPQRLDLPPEVAAINEPTEVLMLASDGMLHTLSLPSGTVRSVPVVIDGSEVYVGQSLVVAPDAAALSTGSGIMIVLRDAPTTIEIDADRFDGEGVDVAGWRPAPDGTTRFLVFSYGSQGQNASYEVGLDGEVTVIGEGGSVISREYSTSRTDDGRAYVNDAGGVYEIGVDGSAARIDDGVLRGVSSKMLLIRQCTSDLVCGDVLVDRTTGERRPIVDGVVPDDMQFSGFGLDLAPDGSAISGIVDSVNSQELAVVDLLTGDRLATDAQGWGRGSRWAADSSGVFESSASGTGVEFLSLAAGAQVHFADELEQVVALGVRRPASELASEPALTTVPITFAADPGPSATGLDVIVLTRSGNLAEVDIDARTANIWSAPEAIAVRGPAVFRLDGQVAVLTNDSPDGETSGYLATPGGEQALPPGLFGDGPILAGPAPGTAWTSATTVAGSAIVGVQQVLIDLATARPAEPPQSIGVPGGVRLGGDGRGNLVVERGGDVYIATSAGDVTDLRRLTSGELLAIGVDTAYVRECDDASACSVIRVDRVGGARITVPELLGLLPASAIDATDPPFGLVGTCVAPGGGVFVVSTVDGWLLVDAASGGRTQLGSLDGAAPFVWSPDGRSAVTLSGADLVVVGVDGVTAVEGLGSLRALAGAPVVVTD